MKIKWVAGRKMIPRIGIINTGDVLEVSTEVGNALIKQGQASKYIKKPAKKKEGGE